MALGIKSVIRWGSGAVLTAAQPGGQLITFMLHGNCSSSTASLFFTGKGRTGFSPSSIFSNISLIFYGGIKTVSNTTAEYKIVWVRGGDAAMLASECLEHQRRMQMSESSAAQVSNESTR